MPPKKATATAGESNLTARDQELLAAALRASKTEISIDYQKFADLAGFSTAASARTAWSNLRIKVGFVPGAGANDDRAKAEGKRGKKRKVDVEDADDAEALVKKGRGGKKAKKEAEVGDDGGAEDDGAKSPVAARKGKGGKKRAKAGAQKVQDVKKEVVAEDESSGEGEEVTAPEDAKAAKNRTRKRAMTKVEGRPEQEEDDNDKDGDAE